MNWKKNDIRKARKVDLAPVLKNRGFTLIPRCNENYIVSLYDDLVIKDCYWRWPSKNLSGNSIDFFMAVEGKSFNESMTVLKNYLPDT